MFRRVFGYEADGRWAAPGRVNLIGEHTDYNDGLVLPFAIADRAEVAISARDDGHLRICSAQVPGASWFSSSSNTRSTVAPSGKRD